MYKNILKKILIITGSIFLFCYLMFLILPLLLIPVLDTASTEVASLIQKSTGFRAEFYKFRIVTTPKLTFGIRLQNAKIYEPNGDIFLDSSNLQVKASVLPLFLKQLRLDLISADDINLNVKVNPDGTIFVADYFKTNDVKSENPKTVIQALPFNFKLSNKLPDIRIKKHRLNFIDIKTSKNYTLDGSDSNITDFIFNKKIKAETEGKIIFDNHKVLDYEIKIFNHLMPQISFNDFIFGDIEKNENNVKSSCINFNILKFFEQIKDKKIQAEIDVELDISGNFEKPVLVGEISLDGISMLLNGKMLPESKIELNFNKDGFEIDSDFYTAVNENIKIEGVISRKKLSMVFRSSAGLNNIFEIVKQVLNAIGIQDFDSMVISGKLDADFKIESDYKSIVSNGGLKLASGAIKWGLYDVKIDNLVCDILLNNNTVLINKLGFTTFSVPFSINGKITPDAKLDINVLTDKLVLKSLLVSLGQGAILKENPIYSGLISIKAKIQGEMLSPSIDGNIDVVNFKLKNIPSDILLSFNPLNLDLKTTKTGFMGNAKAQNIKLENPAFFAYIPSLVANLDENKIDIQNSKTYFGKNEFNLKGTISDYLKEKIILAFKTEGKLNSNLQGFINPYKMTLGLDFAIPTNSQIIIPGFDKSIVDINGAVSIIGSIVNPILKGRFICPKIVVPEVPMNINDAIFSLDGSILNGSGTIKEFVSGGIKAFDVSFGFKLQGNDFYLNNLKGSAFDGIFDGNVVYNLTTTLCKVVLNGSSMNALKAIEGAAGIKNALTGTLSFDSDLNFKGVDFIDMMKTLKGCANFEIKNGILANLGSLKTLLNAQNILNNVILKNTVQSVSTLHIVQQTSEFNFIKGNLTFNDGYAKLEQILMQGPKMAYYITGKYNLINYSIDAVILGRLSSEVVSVLGNIGNFASDTFSSLLPGFGSLTSSVAKMMNESPKNVDISKIPNLSTNSDDCKEFKAVFQGSTESSHSVKSFKWINEINTSDIDKNTASSELKVDEIKDSVKQNVDNTINSMKTNFSTSVTSGKEALSNTKEQAKELFNSLLNRSNSNSEQ